MATLGPDPLAGDFTVDTLAGLLAGRRTQVKGVLRDQRIIAGIGNAYSDEVLHAARMSPFKIAASMTPADVATLYDAIKTTLSEAVERSAGLAAADLKGEKKSGLRVHGRDRPALRGVRRHHRGGLVRRLRAPVLPDLPDRRQAARRPPPVSSAQIGLALPGTRSNVCAAGYPVRRHLGAIAQLEERLVCIQKARGSSPLSSTGGHRQNCRCHTDRTVAVT